MMSILKNDRGLSLIELLVSVSLLSMILLIVTSIQLFGQNQFMNQTEHVDSQADVRYAMNDIQRKIRSADGSQITTKDDAIYLNNEEWIYFEAGSSTIWETVDEDKNKLVDNIKMFTAHPDEDHIEKTKITIESFSPTNGQSTTISSSIYIRN
ncbi:hypothetical protein CR203_17760 [Salipaludibacillus neizhouensis]|uniref:Prepilin-type cleavage/methylation domain-containing protein n=2 Tax=Salipaludibacillus neizhouensis TaxID=885475 RepID=A0A3A9K0L6_9BACI|nr:hypothetical protein CR203_17760 [Salipaludibacillus neizhouensis]